MLYTFMFTRKYSQLLNLYIVFKVCSRLVWCRTLVYKSLLCVNFAQTKTSLKTFKHTHPNNHVRLKRHSKSSKRRKSSRKQADFAGGDLVPEPPGYGPTFSRTKLQKVQQVVDEFDDVDKHAGGYGASNGRPHGRVFKIGMV